MKQLLFSAILFLFSISVFAQATPVGELRVADAATPFGVNVPVGTKVFNYATGVNQYWVAKTAALSTETLSTASAKFVLLNEPEQSLTSAIGVISLSKTAADGTVGTASTVTITGDQILVETGAGANEIKLTAQQTLSVTSDASINTVSLENGDEAVLTAATAAKAGLMTAAQWTTLFSPTTPETGRLTVDAFEQGVADATFTLSATPKPGMSLMVSLNGQELPLSVVTAAGPPVVYAANGRGYTISGTTLTINLPTLPYDKVVVTYMK
jgi:hypothetical protein